MDVRKIGDAIRYLRIREGYTQQDIADIFGISFQAVSKWERGICIPDAVYLPQLAQHFNVELDDLLEGNIKYLDDEWAGWLKISDCDFLLVGKKSILNLSLCYFMLAGIRNITIQGQARQLEQIELYTKSYLEKYGLKLSFVSESVSLTLSGQHVMLVSAPVFLYGTNLTKYFWKGMSRKDGISVLTVQSGDMYTRISVDKKGLIKKNKDGASCALPICFIPNRFLHVYDKCGIYESGILYAEPTARGLIHKFVSSENDLEKVEECIELIANMSGEKLYDLGDIARARFLHDRGK